MASVGSSNNKNKTFNTKKVSTGKINTKKVFPRKDGEVKVEEISINEALSSRVRRNQNLYNKPSDKKVSNTNTEEKLSNTKQQKFNFDSKKIKIEDDMDNSFFTEKKKKTKPKVKEKPKEEKNVSVKIENIPMKKAIKKNKNKNDSMVVTMLFLSVVIVFMGVFLIYHFGTFDHNKVKVKYKNVEVVPENIVFLGDSITEFYDVEKYFPKKNVVNSGISGNTTQDILDDMKNRVYRYNPSQVFLLIGTNDLVDKKLSIEDTENNVEEIIKNIKKKLPKTKVYVESIYPINDSNDDKIDSEMIKNRNNKDIKEINKEIKKIAKKEKITYIDMYDELVDEDGDLSLDYTKEGLHLSDEGYEKVTFVLKKYFNL